MNGDDLIMLSNMNILMGKLLLNNFKLLLLWLAICC